MYHNVTLKCHLYKANQPLEGHEVPPVFNKVGELLYVVTDNAVHAANLEDMFTYEGEFELPVSIETTVTNVFSLVKPGMKKLIAKVRLCGHLVGKMEDKI